MNKPKWLRSNNDNKGIYTRLLVHLLKTNMYFNAYCNSVNSGALKYMAQRFQIVYWIYAFSKNFDSAFWQHKILWHLYQRGGKSKWKDIAKMAKQMS